MDRVDKYIRQGIKQSLRSYHPPITSRRRLLQAATQLKQGAEFKIYQLLSDVLIKGHSLELPEGFEISAYHENRLFPPIFVFFFLRPV